MPPAAQSVTQGLQLLTHWILILAVPLAGIGALSMALIQPVKNMLPLRRWFQRNLERYLHPEGCWERFRNHRFFERRL